MVAHFGDSTTRFFFSSKSSAFSTKLTFSSGIRSDRLLHGYGRTESTVATCLGRTGEEETRGATALLYPPSLVSLALKHEHIPRTKLSQRNLTRSQALTMTEAREDDEQYRYPMEGIARFDTFPTESFRYHLQYDGDRGRIRLSSKKTNVHWCGSRRSA